jgi:hypothetical protein
MKIKYIILAGIVVALSSCSTAYRSGQTPDDVYYSPAPVENSYVNSVTSQDRNSYAYRNSEEAQIRQGIQDPLYRSPITLDLGFGYGYSPYYSYNNFGNPFYNNYYDPFGYKGLYNNPYYGYGYYGYNSLGLYSPYNYNYYSPYSYYDPYGYGYYSSGKTNINTNRGVRRYNLNAYTGGGTTTTQSAGVRNSIETTAPATRRTTGVGNVIRRVFSPSSSTRTNNNSNRVYYNNSNSERRSNSNSNSRTFETPQRTYTPPSVSTPSSSGNNNSSNSAPVRTFKR